MAVISCDINNNENNHMSHNNTYSWQLNEVQAACRDLTQSLLTPNKKNIDSHNDDDDVRAKSHIRLDIIYIFVLLPHTPL